MATGLAVVVSDLPGNRAVVRHSDTGLTFPVDDLQLLTKRLAAVESPELRRRLGKRAADGVRGYSIQAIAKVHRALYSESVAGLD